MAKVHFIGAGQMAEAIIRASLSAGTLRSQDISLEDIDPNRIALNVMVWRRSGRTGNGYTRLRWWYLGSARRMI